MLKSSPDSEVEALFSRYGRVEKVHMHKAVPDAVWHKASPRGGHPPCAAAEWLGRRSLCSAVPYPCQGSSRPTRASAAFILLRRAAAAGHGCGDYGHA